MAHQASLSESQTTLTTILVNNLHCPSCISHVDEVLSALEPPPLSISTSIVLQEIKVEHPITLGSSRIILALQDAAFDIDSVISNGSDNVDLEAQSPPRDLSKHDASSQSQRHIEKCDECAAQLKSATSKTTLVGVETRKDKKESPSSSETQLTSVVTDQPSHPARITLVIGGMSCSSCVSKITGTLQAQPWVQSADVNLLTTSAVVVVRDKGHVDEVLELVQGSGYTATLVEYEELQAPKPSTSTDTWRASFAIGGMTCSSCVGKVTESLRAHDWVTQVDVNLVSSSATVQYQGQDNVDRITETIQSLGYTAVLEDVENTSATQQATAERSISLDIAGMHCEHCPKRILDALSTIPHHLEVTTSPSVASPKLTIRYLPDPPGFTIRHIIRTVANIDPAFTVSVYHPPTLEERSQAMHRRQQWQITRRLILAVLSAIPAFIIGIVYMTLVPKNNPGRQYLEQPMWSGQATRIEWALLFTSTPVYFFAADLFHRRMFAELKALWRPGSKTPILRRFYRFGSMDMLISLGTSIAYFSSIAFLAINASLPAEEGGHKSQNESFFDAVVFLTMFLMIGRLLEAYSKAKAGDAVSLLSKLRPTEAALVSPGKNDVTIAIDQLEFGEVVRVANGASPPYDGVIVDGQTRLDESSLTGESMPVAKGVGDEVFAGTINAAAAVSVRITRLSGDSMLDQIICAVREGQTRRAPIERTTDAITGVFVPIVTAIAVLTWIVWLGLGVSGRLPEAWMADQSVGGWEFWSLQFAISVFVVACPCGIGLAAPTALFVGGGLAASHGILVKGGGEAFQEASHLDCIVFDKTGTITQGGEPAITDHEVTSMGGMDEVWRAVLELEQSSSHPIARAVVSFAASRASPSSVQVSTVDEIPGKGMKGSFRAGDDVLDVIVGNEALTRDHGISISATQAQNLDTWKQQAKSVVLVSSRVHPSETWTLSIMLAVTDPVRPEAAQILQDLRNRDIAVWMISGDNPTTAKAVGKMVGISPENIIAGVLPEQKADKVQYLQKTLRGRDSSKRALVAMVGDGINDSPALTVADVGIAIGSGSDIAISSAEFVLVSSGLTALLTLIDLSRVVFRRIKFNFAWALVYNCTAVPVAAGVFYPIVSNGSHVRLDPVWSSLAMALSSVSVICSSLLMKTRLPLVGFRSRRG